MTTTTRVVTRGWYSGANLTYRAVATDLETDLVASTAMTEFPAGSGQFVHVNNAWDTSWTDGVFVFDDGSLPPEIEPITPVVLPADPPTGYGGTFAVTPLQAVVTSPRFATRDIPPVAAGSTNQDSWTISDNSGYPIDLSGKTIRFVAYTATNTTPTDPTAESQTPAFKYETGGNGVFVGGDKNNIVTVQHAADEPPGNYGYFLWNITDSLVLAKGKLTVLPAVSDTT